MDNYTIEHCINEDTELRQTFGGCLLEDDVRHIVGASTGDDLGRLHNLRIYTNDDTIHTMIVTVMTRRGKQPHHHSKTLLQLIRSG